MKNGYGWRTGVFSLLGMFFLLLLLANTQLAMDGVRKGLTLCTETLIPSLFPFLVLSELLIAAGAGTILGRFLKRPLGALFGLSAHGSVSYILGALCGFPVATTTAVTSFERGEISKKELERLVLFANNPSSGFLIGAVGRALFGSTAVGIALFCITLLSSALLGISLNFFCKKSEKIEKTSLNGVQKGLSTKDFTESVRRGFSTLLQVCAFVLFFSCVTECCTYVFHAFSPSSSASVIAAGLLELTTGIGNAVTALPAATAFRASAFFASFGGFSVCLQIFSVAQGKDLRLGRYLSCKLLQGGIALALSEGYLRLFRPSFTPTQSVDAFARSTSAPFLSCIILLLVLFFLHAAKRKKRI